MATKIESLYNALLPMKVVNFDDIVEKATAIIETNPDRKYVYRKYVRSLIKKGKLQRIRRGLYIVLSPLEEPKRHIIDKLLIASKIKDEHYLGFHTALEYYGCANSFSNEAYICIKAKDRFDLFKYKRFSFKPVFVNDTTIEVEQKKYQTTTIKVSSKERTFIDCIDKLQYAGGWEEAIKSLEGLGGINLEKLLNHLYTYDKDILYRRVGYVLELLKNRSQFYEDFNEQLLVELKKRISGPPRYLIDTKEGTLDKRWQLYIPQDFHEKLRGL
jgi:predicted transcriptional regulator of viral defense system